MHSKKNTTLYHKQHQQGATLIELMVSVFVFAIGVLGFSALQTRSLQATYDNAQREDVVWIADSLVGRIRANKNATSDYMQAVEDFPETCPAVDPAMICSEQSDGSGVAACTSAEIAAYDVWNVLCDSNTASGAIRNSGGMNTVKGLAIELTCDDAIASDIDACSTGSNLTLDFTWCAKSIEADSGSDDCAQVWSQQSYTLEFRP